MGDRLDELVDSRDAERAVMAVWETVLNSPVSRDDNFFRQGGDSLGAARVIARLKAQGYSSSVGVLLTHPTLHEFAAHLIKDAEVDRFPAADIDGAVVPLSDAQQAFWAVLQNGAEGDGLFEILDVIHLTGDVDADALQAAADTVAARHEALRSTVLVLSGGEGEAVQVVHPPGRVAIGRHDLTALDENAFPEACRRAQRAGSRPFDLRRERPFRLELYRLGPAASLLTVMTHHLFCDGRSMSILRADLAAAYSAHVTGEPITLPVPAPYRAYVAANAHLKTPAVVQRHRTFWRDYLRGFPHADLPTDFVRPTFPTYDAAELNFAVPPAVLGRVAAFCADRQVTKFAVLVAAFAAALGQVTGADDVLIGVSVARRSSVEHEFIVGELTHTVPLRLRLPAGADVADLCLHAAEDFKVVVDHADVHYRALLPELRDNQGFQLRMALHDHRSEELSFAGLDAERVTLGKARKRDNRDARLDVWDTGRELRGVVTYRTELFRRESMERVARLITEKLADLGGATRKDAPPADRPVR
jgi:aryl carrier-like protein